MLFQTDVLEMYIFIDFNYLIAVLIVLILWLKSHCIYAIV